MKRMVALFFAFMMMTACGKAMADEGTKTDGDFLFNNLAWGTHKDDVFKAITEMCSGIEIEAEEEEIEFGNLLQVICTYKNKQSGESICKVGEMEVKQIVAEYLCEDGKYDYALYAISFQSEDRSSFENILEKYQASLGCVFLCNFLVPNLAITPVYPCPFVTPRTSMNSPSVNTSPTLTSFSK